MNGNNAVAAPAVHYGLTNDPVQILAELEAAREELAEYKKRERIEQENRALQDRARREPRYISTRNTLVLRRTPKHEIIAPARDVFSYLDIYDLKEVVKEEKTKVRVSDEEIKTYQNLQAEGHKEITLDMINAAIKGKGGKVEGDENAGQEDETATMEDAAE